MAEHTYFQISTKHIIPLSLIHLYQRSRHFGNRHFGTVDIMGIDVLGIDILGIDILGIDIAALPRKNCLFSPQK